MTPIPFTKMAGTGNDFLIVDARPHTKPGSSGRSRGFGVGAWSAVSRSMCDRHRGVGADGLLVLGPSRRADVRMRIFNPDGSEAEMCGNGARCVAGYEVRQQATGNRQQAGLERRATIETKAGLLSATVRGNRVAMRMTAPTQLAPGLTVKVDGRPVSLGFINTGVPHAVVPVNRLDEVDVPGLGRALRRHRQFAPAGANVDFIEPHPTRPNRVRVRTYERGVEGETLACGTGVVASAILYGLNRPGSGSNGVPRTHRIEVEARSGDLLTVSFTTGHNGRRLMAANVVLEGAVAHICEGSYDWSTRRRQ